MPLDGDALLHKALFVVSRYLGQEATAILEQIEDKISEAKEYAAIAQEFDPAKIMICAKCRKYHPPMTACGVMCCARCGGKWHPEGAHDGAEEAEVDTEGEPNT